MTESDFWSRLRGKLGPGHFVRVENPCDPGTPDVSFCVSSRRLRADEGWLELKFRAQMPTDQSTPILTEKHGIRPAQKIWIRRRLDAGGLVLIGVGVCDSLFLFHGRCAEVLNGWGEIDYLMNAFSRVSRHDGEAVSAAFRDAIDDFRS